MRMPCCEMLQDGDGQGGALSGIRAGPQLVEEHQAVRGDMLQKGHDVCHVGGEGAEALLNALLVPDVREHIGKYAQLGAVQGRDVEACLAHQGEKPNGFQGDCLSSCVGACDDEQVKSSPSVREMGTTDFGSRGDGVPGGSGSSARC